MAVYENTITKPLFSHTHKPLQEYRANKTSPYKLYRQMQNDIQRCKFPESKPEITITRLSITLDVSVHLLTPAFKPGQENHKIRA